MSQFMLIKNQPSQTASGPREPVGFAPMGAHTHQRQGMDRF